MSLNLAIQLLEEEIISQDQFVLIVREYESSRPPEISIALSHSLVTTLQARTIMNFQNEHPEKSFCEIAICLGFLNAEQCQQLNQIQDGSRRSIRQILVDLGICTQSQLGMLDRSLRFCSGASHRSGMPTPKFTRRIRSTASAKNVTG